jgi:hydroxyethylthiazole kinase-like uncharacterized protein yjeF
MTELLTAAQMRAIEQAAIASGGVTGLELMERAGRGVVEAIFEEWPELQQTSHRAVVLCGPGNNGGDGFVVARLLKEWGWEVEVFLYGDPEKLPPDARANYERWCGMGEVSEAVRSLKRLYEKAPVAHVVVDALFGTGLSRLLTEDIKECRAAICADDGYLLECEGVDRHFVAVDIPSGRCSDSGKVLGSEFPADLIVTFHRAKVGHHLPTISYGRLQKLRVKEIGLQDNVLPRWALERAKSHDPSINAMYLGKPVPDFAREDTVETVHSVYCGKAGGFHKYSHGHALILSGGAARGGAARLAARGALRIGAGLVTVGCPPEALTENAARLDAVMLKPLADADAFARVLEDSRINALCLGPGLGTGEREVALVAAALSAKRPLVLDADALTILAREPGLFAALHENCVLTPHAGEFARLFPDIAEKLAAPATKGPAYSKVDATREAAERAGCVVLYKGPDTVIADPKGRCSINSAHYDRAAPWLATAGSGDVLAGFITGLLARGFSPMQAAETGAWLHVECARKFGPGLIAEDLAEQIPAVFRDLGL